MQCDFTVTAPAHRHRTFTYRNVKTADLVTFQALTIKGTLFSIEIFSLLKSKDFYHGRWLHRRAVTPMANIATEPNQTIRSPSRQARKHSIQPIHLTREPGALVANLETVCLGDVPGSNGRGTPNHPSPVEKRSGTFSSVAARALQFTQDNSDAPMLPCSQQKRRLMKTFQKSAGTTRPDQQRAASIEETFLTRRPRFLPG
jgi:hypothetical protein